MLSGSPVCSVKPPGYSGFCDQDPNWHPFGGKKGYLNQPSVVGWFVFFFLVSGS